MSTEKTFVRERTEGICFTAIYLNEQVELMIQIGSRFGVSATVIAGEGKPYTYNDIVNGKHTKYSGIVPEGQSYIMITSAKLGIDDFWQALEEAQKSK